MASAGRGGGQSWPARTLGSHGHPHLSPAWGQAQQESQEDRRSGAVFPTGWLGGPAHGGPGSSHPLRPPRHSRRLQLAPRNPAGQRQAPVAASQESPWTHSHCCSQPGPKRPGGHSAGTQAGARGQGPGLAPWHLTPTPGMSSPSSGQPGRLGSRRDNGTSAHSSPQRGRVGRLGCRRERSVLAQLRNMPPMWPRLGVEVSGAARGSVYLSYQPLCPPGWGHLPCSQPGPVEPGGQRHSPVTWWQAAPGGHRQRWAQASPNRPSGQAAGSECGGGGEAWGQGSPEGSLCQDPPPRAAGPVGAAEPRGSPFSHREPLHPGGQRQAPVTWWQVAPRWQAQRSSHCAPNVPSAQAAVGETRQRAESGARGASRAKRPPPLPRGTPGSSDGSPCPHLPRDYLTGSSTLERGSGHPLTGPAGPPGLPPRPSPQPGPLTALTLVPGPAGWTEAAARAPLTEAAVETSATVLAAGSKAPAEALCGAQYPSSAPRPQGPGDPHPTRASCTQSLGPRPGEGEGPGGRSHRRPASRELCPQRVGWASMPWGTRPGSRVPPPPLPDPGSPCSQARPAQPSGHVQWPDTGSQVPPCWQRQACSQLGPYKPVGQAAGGGEQLAAAQPSGPHAAPSERQPRCCCTFQAPPKPNSRRRGEDRSQGCL